MYMYCTHCAKVTKASIVGILKDQLDCGICGTHEKLKGFTQTICDHCGDEMYIPQTMRAVPACPCLKEKKVISPASQKAPQVPVQAAPSTPDGHSTSSGIKCEHCPAILPFVDGEYGVCPLCGRMPSEAYLNRQRYLSTQTMTPIILSWEPEVDELLYQHHHSSDIPQDSLIIVNPHQSAFYFAGGKVKPLGAQQTFATYEKVDIAKVARSLRENSDAFPLFNLGLNTKVIFVDHRWHTIDLTIPIELGEWIIDLKTEIQMQIPSVEAAEILFSNAFDFRLGSSVSEQLTQRMTDHVLDELRGTIAGIPLADIREANTEQQVRLLLRNHLNDQGNDLKNTINRSLLTRFGITLFSLDFLPFFQSLCRRSAVTERVNQTICAELPGDTWQIELPIELNVRHSLKDASAAAATAQLKRDAENLFKNALSELSSSRIKQILNADELRTLLAQWFRDHESSLISQIGSLSPDLKLQSLSAQTGMLACKDVSNTQLVPCPFPCCNEIHRIPKGVKKFKCEHTSNIPLPSGEKKNAYIRWCSNPKCQKYTSDYKRTMVCDSCNTRYIT